MKFKASGRPWLYLRNVDANKNAFFDIQNGRTGTISAGVTATIKALQDGWYRIFAGCTSATTTDTWKLCIASADNTLTHTGDSRDACYIWGSQLESGLFPTIYVPRLDATAASRAADSETWIPWSVSKALLPCLSAAHQAQVKLHFRGTESLNAATVTPTTGAYTFAKNGRPQNGYTEAEQDFFLCNGSTDFLSLADASGGSDFDFSTAGQKFSVTFAYTPLAVASTTFYPIVGKWSGATNKRQWQIYQYGTAINFAVSKNGTTVGTALTVNSCLEAGKPVLITVTYDGSGGDGASAVTLYVDAATSSAPDYQESSSTAVAPLYNSDTEFKIGSFDAYYMNGKLLQLLVLDHGVGGAVVSAAEHAAMYAAWKQPGMLDLTMNAASPKTKIIIELEAKGLYSSTSNIGEARRIITVGGATGQCSSTKNMVAISSDADGKLTAFMYENSGGTKRFISSAARTDLDGWHKHVFVLDLADSASSTYTIDGIAQTLDASMTGIGNQLDLLDALVRIGQPTTAIPDLNGSVRALKIYAQ